MSRINWANVALMIVIVVVVMWAVSVVCILWDIRESLNYIALSTDAQFQMMDGIWTELSWLLQDTMPVTESDLK
jgi:uncharacterized protein YoxC